MMTSSKRIKAYFLLFIFLVQNFFPPVAMALTGGPSQPEVQSFEPAGTSEMVDLSSGSFTYNIPLLDVGGYPVNLSYNAGATMDQEATCVGLGWNINPGVINRNMRGIPDDFDGEDLAKEFNLKPNRTYGGNFGVDLEAFGFDKVKPTLQAGMFYNNYKGVGLEFGLGVSPTLLSASFAKDKLTSSLGLNLNINLNSQSGATTSAAIKPSLAFGEEIGKKTSEQKEFSVSATGGLGYNSRQGMLAATLGANMQFQGTETTSTGKKILKSRSLGLGSSSFSFARPTYLPSADMPISNLSFTLRGAFEGAVFGIDPGVSISGYYSQQRLATKKLKSKGYGTLYLQNQKPGVSLLDFNREKDGPFTQNTPNLSVPVAAQDIYNVTGQGIGGSYMLKRSDIGVFSDKQSVVNSASGNQSVEFGAGNLVKVGADIVGVGVEAKNGAWIKDNNLAPNLGFKGGTSGSLYEPAYFKPAGEMSVESDPTLFNSIGGFDVVDAKIQKDPNDKFKINVNSDFRVGNNQTNKPVSGPISRANREKRNQNISYLTAEEAANFGLNKYIESYVPRDFTSSPIPINRVNANSKKKHISEITTLREDGMRYVYGIPAYNVKQQDYHFSVKNAGDCKSGLVTYTALERSIRNSSGRDNLYSMEETPPYAHSYLLSAVLSPDFSDVDGVNGPSSGDLGSYTKFNYTRVHTNYKWRLPVQDGIANRANYSPGLLSDPLDNKGSVVYGEKEIWHLHSIDSKTYKAQFYYSYKVGELREDAYGAELDGLPSTVQRMVRLDSIVLYSKSDLIANGAAAIPIKKVTFNYDYSLCKGLPNSLSGTGGKLTLKSIYFTYGRSNKGRFSPYKFTYAGETILGTGVLDYNNLGYNRWGSFQRSFKTNSTGCATTDDPGNDDYPYVVQDSATQANYAIAWNLTSIELPSGGKIDVTYESHDYAYTQNKSAMEMFNIAGFGETSTYGTGKKLYSETPGVPEKTQYSFLYFKLKSPVTGTASVAKTIIGRDYIKDIQSGSLYFKCLTNLKSTIGTGCSVASGGCPHYEYVYGYASVADWGVCPGNSNYGFIELKNVCLNDKDKSTTCAFVNPIAKAGWQFTRLFYPDLIHSTNLAQPTTSPLPNGQPTGLNNFLSIVEAFADMFKGLEITLTGMNRFCLNNNYAQVVETKKSWIRLYNPTGVKLAGGSRVKRIKISDSWQTMSTVVDNGVYGQEFSYRTELDLGGGTKRSISSGVASYEPMVGGDENPFRQPETYDETLRLAPDNHYYQESPYGESFFPSPQIVYSKVTVTSLKYNTSGTLVTPNCVSTGRTVSEYYTAKDYPTRVTKTPIQVIPAKSSPLVSFLKLDYKEYMNASQGFCVELNDMHGKPKAQWNYDDKGQRISGVEYLYKTKKRDTDPSPSVVKLEPMIDSLDNTATVISRTGAVSQKQIGVDFQMISDSRESTQDTRTLGVALNTDAFLVGLFPAAAIVPWPIWESEKVRFRSMTISKVINRYAILEKVVAYDASSRIETENLAYDEETGEVLLTKTYNEFGDPIYNLKYPAHFAYTGMRPAYENMGLEIKNALYQSKSTNFGSRIALSVATAQYFEPGDELLISNAANVLMRGWVLNVNNNNNNLGSYYIDVINDKGEDLPYSLNDLLNLKIIRSGKRNQQMMQIGSVTLNENPLQPIPMQPNQYSLNLSFSLNPILNAEATEYSDYWQYQDILGCTNACVSGGSGSRLQQNIAPCPIQVTNPFNFGLKGVWRPKKSWTHLKDRNPTTPSLNYQTDIRKNGTYVSFSPFWKYATNPKTTWNSDVLNWTWSSEVRKYNNYGFQLETVDPLNRFSAELPGYNNTQAIAVAANARYREIHYDGFEENNLSFLNLCSTGEFMRFDTILNLSKVKTYSHTGDYSMQVGLNSTISTKNGVPVFLPSNDVALVEPTVLTRLADPNKLPKFGFMKDSTYLISVWIRTDEPLAINKTSYNLNTRVEILQFLSGGGASAATIPINPSGPVIDGWQRCTILFTPLSTTVTVKFEFKNSSSSYYAFFDDFRIQPFRSAMKTYVYDINSTRLRATLDDENYATFYEYDQGGMLERVKRETERGIMTVQETRTSLKKQ